MTDRATPATPVAPDFVSGFCAPEARIYVLIAAILASSMGFIDGTVVAIALPAIRSALDATLIESQWVHNGYALTLASLILVGGALGDRFGPARVFAGGIAMFVAASLLCALAPEPGMLVLARAVQGVGAAIMVPGSLALIARAYPTAERGRAIGIWAAASALATASGPIIGGLALSFGGPDMWRWIFAINLPLGAVAIALLLSLVQTDTARPDTPVDLAGAALATTALFTLAWGLTAAGQGQGAIWILASVCALGLFLWVEMRQAHPMLPLGLFRNAMFSAANLLSFTLYSGLSIIFFYMPMLLVAGWGLREIDAALAFAPLTLFISVLSAQTGKWAGRFGPAPLLAAGGICLVAGYVMMALTVSGGRFWDGVLPAMGLVGLGMALVVAPLSTAVMASVGEQHSGLASGINNAVSRMAGLISVAAVGGVVAATYARLGGSHSYGDMATEAAHVAAMSATFATVAWIAACLSGLSAAVALAMLRLKSPEV